MSNELESNSNEVSAPQERDSVFDFLYQDARRIGSFLSQFDRDGHLTALTRTSSFSEGTGSDSGMGGSAGVTAVASLSATGNRHVTESSSDLASKTYDPMWANSLALLDYLEQRDFIHRELAKARIGQFAMVTGKLVVFDMSVIKAFLLSKRGAEAIAKGIIESEKEGAKKKSPAEKAIITQFVQELMRELPFAVQMHMRGDGFGIWSSLRGESLELSVDDLLLKHGASIAGDWNMLGIVDALPDEESTNDFSFFNEGEMGKHAAELLTTLRPKIGRPKTSYGMTPLLIFREVSGG